MRKIHRHLSNVNILLNKKLKTFYLTPFYLDMGGIFFLEIETCLKKKRIYFNAVTSSGDVQRRRLPTELRWQG